MATTPPALRGLHEKRISIIDWTAPPRVFESDGDEPDPRFPDYAIEDIGSDYLEDEDEGGEGPDEDDEIEF